MSRPDLSKVPLAKLAEEIWKRAREEAVPFAEGESIAIDLACAIRLLGFYAQVWLPSDANDRAMAEGPLTDDELSDIFHKMTDCDEASMEANANLIDDLISDAIKSRERKEDAR